MGQDTINIEILADGTIKSETDKVSNANHISADAFMKYVSELAGGKTTRTRRPHSHTHIQDHEHDHEHENH